MRLKSSIAETAACLMVLLVVGCTNRTRLADEHFQKGRAFEKLGKPDSALVYYRLAVAVEPKHMKAAMAYQDLAIGSFGKEDEVWDRYETLARKHPGDPACQVLFTRLLENRDLKIEKALGIVERNPDFFWGQVLLGTAYQEYINRDYSKEAMEAYEKASKIDSADIETYVQLADLSRRADDYSKREKYVRKAIALDSARIDLLPSLWESEYALASNKDSMKTILLGEMDGTLAKHGDNLRFLRSLLGILSVVDRERSERLQKEIVALDPKGQEAQRQVISSLYSEKNPKQGIKKAETFLNDYPESPYRPTVYALWFRFAQQIPGMGDEDVENFVAERVGQNKGSDALYASLYDYYSKKHPEAFELLKRSLQRQIEATSNRKKPAPLNNLGRLYLKQDRPDEALKALLLADSLSRKHQNPSSAVYGSLGEAYQRKGDLDKALDCYSQSIGLGDNDAVLDKFYSAYEKKFGSREDARKFINQKVLAASALKKPFPAPEFTLATVEGQKIQLADLRDKVVLIAIWNPG